MTRTRLKLLLAGASALTFSPVAMAQAPLSPVDQIGASNAGAVEQISDGSTDIIAPVRTELRQSMASPRPTLDERTPGATQLTAETGLTRNSAQVSTGGRSSEASTPLSRPSEGRTATAVDRLVGSDRCDPSHRDAARAKACAQVIEKRAAEFSPREATPLSPEQRILMEQQRRADASDSRGAARRLATTGTDSDSPELQGIASLVLRAPPEPPKTSKPIEDQNGLDATAAIVNAVIGQINAPPPQ